MQIPLLILIGIAIWAVSVALARRFGTAGGSAAADTTLGFITVWFLALATSLWVSVAEGRYPTRNLVAAYALIFGLPASVAALFKSRIAATPDTARSGDPARHTDGNADEDRKT